MPSFPARIGTRVWRLFTSVDFAVAQLIVLALMGTVGMTLGQLPDVAYRSASDYASELEKIHLRYDPTLGAGLVTALDGIGAFSVFHSWWFSLALVVLLLSIVICTVVRSSRTAPPSTGSRAPRSRGSSAVTASGSGARRGPTAPSTSTATGTSTRRWRPSSPTSG
jgi:hypothetical protein